jgi:hypothetical protein
MKAAKLWVHREETVMFTAEQRSIQQCYRYLITYNKNRASFIDIKTGRNVLLVLYYVFQVQGKVK